MKASEDRGQDRERPTPRTKIVTSGVTDAFDRSVIKVLGEEIRF